MTFKTSCAIIWALTKRDCIVLYSNLYDRLLDGMALVFVQVLAFGYLLPLMGMPQALCAPLYLANVIQIFFFIGYATSIYYVFDLRYKRIIDYHLALPLPKKYLFAQYAIKYSIEALIIGIPLISLGIIGLGSQFPLHAMHLPSLIGISLASLLFFSFFFIYFGISSPYTWFMDNAWPRRLLPLFLLSTSLCTWESVYAFNPTIAYIFLVNPITYITEGFRASFFSDGLYLPISWCIMATLFFSALAMIGLYVCIPKKT